MLMTKSGMISTKRYIMTMMGFNPRDQIRIPEFVLMKLFEQISKCSNNLAMCKE